MRVLNIANLDLNLLLLLDAVHQEGSIVRAANRLGMSQPAASHALARLRHALGDDLFVRTGHGMKATVHGGRLAIYVRRALMELELGLRTSAFDPALSERRFSIAADNYSVVVLTGPLLAAIAAEVPHVQVTVRPSGTLDVERMMDNGELDLVIGGPNQPRDRFMSEPLLTDEFVALRRTSDAPARPLSLEEFAALPHIHLSSTQDDVSFIGHALAAHGLSRRVVHSVPLLACESVLETYEALVIMRRAMAATFCARGRLMIHDLPFPAPQAVTSMKWHRSLLGEEAHSWLRHLLKTTAAAVGASTLKHQS